MKVTTKGVTEVRYCTSCKTEHIGKVPCGLTWKQRMGTVDLDWASLETRDKKNYFDQEALDDSFGPDAQEVMMDETDGMGYRTAEQVAKMSPEETKAYLGLDKEDD
jgi:hypothetical protein